QPGGRSWTNMLTIIKAIEAMPSQGVLSGVSFRSVGYTQAASATDTVDSKIADLTAMCADFDALHLPGTASKPLDFYFEIAAPPAWAQRLHPSAWGTYAFCRDNRNGRSWGVSPWYQWPFDSAGRIHLNAYGTARLGEMEGYARFVREDEGGGRGTYRPLWRSLTRSLAVRGQEITVPFDRPSGVGFTVPVR
ncbi:MAG TPA: hypothetical protein VE224_13965, partial [Pseudolabrys sp.]|nr:hypothetical protein [Pseudolabrys sp.]